MLSSTVRLGYKHLVGLPRFLILRLGMLAVREQSHSLHTCCLVFQRWHTRPGRSSSTLCALDTTQADRVTASGRPSHCGKPWSTSCCSGLKMVMACQVEGSASTQRQPAGSKAAAETVCLQAYFDVPLHTASQQLLQDAAADTADTKIQEHVDVLMLHAACWQCRLELRGALIVASKNRVNSCMHHQRNSWGRMRTHLCTSLAP